MKITITGFMGSGKSYFSERLAARLNLNFLDLDRIIEKDCKMSVRNIININGEKYFRTKEKKLLIETLTFDDFVLALGGGTLHNENCAKIVAKDTFCVFLNTPFDKCFQRIHKSQSRPLAVNKTSMELWQLYESRLEIYKNTADMVLEDCDFSTVDFNALANKIYLEAAKKTSKPLTM